MRKIKQKVLTKIKESGILNMLQSERKIKIGVAKEMKVKAYRVTGTKLEKIGDEWQEDYFAVITCNPKKFKVDGVIVGELLVEPVKAEFDVTDEMLETAEITPYVARKRGKKDETNE